jgi:dienelactone hydrolase
MEMTARWLIALVSGAVLISCSANAQGVLGIATQAKDLTFPAAPSVAAAVDGSRMALLKPNGAGPFPAIVLHHQCAGLHTLDGKPNRSMGIWAQDAVRQGYVVLLIDSLGQRDVVSVCDESKKGVNFPRGIRDAMQAADYLRTLPYVDKKRIAHVGFSWGAMTALLGSSSDLRAVLPGSEGFAATVALYPGCFTIKPTNGAPPFEIVRHDIDHPVLVLMGDKDVETPADGCVGKLQSAKGAGAPVEWYVFRNATHCWDCVHLNGTSRMRRGINIIYRFNASVTEETKRRVFEFLQRSFLQKSRTAGSTATRQ